MLILRLGPASEPAKGKISVRSAAKRGRPTVAFGTRSFAARWGKITVVKIQLSKSKRRVLTRLKRVKCKATITLRDATSNTSKRIYEFSLRRRQPR